ncbi:sigma-70 family RNA polymerase sigma factor [Pedobacter sp. BS3]|uniref:RNA polymerase sigma factor n=1 Tax=Pedobacter sp. BS3 TaxID=2567937 RepID=UPI0011EE5AF1|nr:sigma-70 family RNA polymerase sigma factor [Pedobacter sp. BS3]TZF82624.1 sigma-70 family RNA polymerase sigma factor [Pedobacter sp. BS3]
MIKEDERAAFSEIYRRYWSELYNTAYKRTRDKAQCQDIIQNIFADLWLRRRQLAINNLSAYLHTAVRFQLYKQIARAPQHAAYLDEFEEIICSPVYADDKVREKEISDLINLWLAALPEKRRKIFLMHYMEELSTREIASELGISQNTVQAQLYTASQSLRTRLAHFMTITLALGFLLNK